jgi:hypothetical protein
MAIKEQLKPLANPRVMDLVAEAGIDVTPWQRSNGPAASNPAFCYDWAHRTDDRVVVNLWHDELVERDGKVFDDLNPRKWARTQKSPRIRKRAKKLDDALAHAFTRQLPVRIIVGEGKRSYAPGAKVASRMRRRVLDPEPWHVEKYDPTTGDVRLTRGHPQFTDQHGTVDRTPAAKRRVLVGDAWIRDRAVRQSALNRAKGVCELCGQPGFRTANGGVYLETHHVQPLSEDGLDEEQNVVALCANDHRMAHLGETRADLRDRLRSILAEHFRTRVG